jgi:hypothetical protein
MINLQLQTLILNEPELRKLNIQVTDLIIAGWTGRDRNAVELHIEELAAVGVAPPRQTPMFYRVAADRLTLEKQVDVVGISSTGEAEFVLLCDADEFWIGIGSDHTDRKAETLGVTWSKQLCPKPLAPQVWRWSDIAPHWDQLMLRCTANAGTHEVLYQQGSVTAIMHPLALLEKYRTSCGQGFGSHAAMFCGTLAAANKIDWAEAYQLELIDPILSRSLRHRYTVRPLPIAEAVPAANGVRF